MDGSVEDSRNLGAQSTSELRGDYSRAGADFTVAQDWCAYTAEEHDRWRRLYAAQARTLNGRACRAFFDGLQQLDSAAGVPDFAGLSRRLRQATGWEIVAVPGFIPDAVFFGHLAHRRFPVTRWIRREDEMGYLVEPDVFHDCFGHVPMLMDPVFADFLQGYGRKGLDADPAALARLARLYWYTVEFGLIREGPGLRIYGAGILSSQAESVHALESRSPLRVAFDADRIMRTRYLIDDFQKTYFVVDSFDQLYAALANARADTPGEDIEPDTLAEGDVVVTCSAEGEGRG
jgi:phenylalanine-4-hydroxylase